MSTPSSSQFETRVDSDEDDQSLEGLRLQRAVEARLFDAEPEPLRVGRFVIVDGIGEGAMGVVYRAFDPELGRPVALKLSQSRVERGGLMMQEAQALARLSHPNVVTIHEVGMHAGRLFLAMELVEGLPLNRWCERYRSSGGRWAARVEGLLEQAARGLRAAHEAGVVHRDLKPSNILVGDDGRLRLVDFGLARTAVAGAKESAPSQDLAGQDAVVGTPAYMAPEQFDGRADELSDEFGLCSTFFEVLYGVRAYTGADRRELEANLRAGRMTEPPARAGPGYLHHVLRKGLAREPAQRHGGIDDLLHALERGRRRRWGLRSSVAGIVAAGVIGGIGWSYSAGTVQPCTGARAQLAGAWDLPRREEVEQAMRTSAVPYAVTTWERIAPRLDAYADAWVQQHTSTCEATAVHEAQSNDVMDRRMGCLHRAKVELGAVSGQLVVADASTVEYAHRMVDELPALRHCADVERLLADVAPPEREEAESVGLLRVQLAEARALRLAGLYDAAVARLETLREQSESIGYAPVRTELSMELGQALGRASRYEDAERYLIGALRSALSQGQWPIAIDVASELMFIVGERADRPQEALAYGQTAWGLIERTPDPVAESELLAHQASVFSGRGEFGTAEEQLRRALATVEPILPSSHYRLGMLHNQLGNALRKQRRLDEAEVELRVALERFVEGQGPTHPYVGGVHANLAGVLKEQGKLAEAEAEARHGQRIWLEVLGPDHLNLAMSHLGLGNILRRLKRLDEAADEYRRAQRVYGEVLGSENRRTLGAGMNLALVLLDQGEYEASEAQSRDLIPRLVTAVGPRHSMVADAHTNLGNALFKQGRYEDAEVEHRRAVEAYASVPEPNAGALAAAYGNVSVDLQHLGRLDEAEVQRRRALKLELEAFGAEHPRVVTSRERLASIEQERGDSAVPASLPTTRRTE